MNDYERLMQQLIVERYRPVPKVRCADAQPISAESHQDPRGKGSDGRGQGPPGGSQREASAR